MLTAKLSIQRTENANIFHLILKSKFENWKLEMTIAWESIKSTTDYQVCSANQTRGKTNEEENKKCTKETNEQCKLALQSPFKLNFA